MLRNLFKFELAFHLKSVGFWLTVVVMIGFGLLLSTDFASLSNEGGSRVKNNGAVPIALSMSFMSLAGILFGAVFVVGGIMRDDTFKSVEIIHATPVSTFNMVISRMMAAWIVVTLCISAVVIGLIAGQFMPWADAESYGPNNPLYFLQPLVVFTLINSLLLTAIYTAIATLTRDKAMVYVSAIGVLVLYIGATFVGGGNAPDWLAPILDPFGTAALGEIVQFWPAAEQNERLVPLNSYVGLNRLLWGGISLALFVFSFLRSTRGIPTRKTKAGEYDNVAPTKDIELHPVTPQLNGGYHFASFARQLRHDYMRTIQSVPFIILSGIAVILFGIVLIGTVILNPDPTIATSTFMARTVVGALAIPMLIIMVFFGGDILWRERTAGIHEILDATPVSNGSLLSAKWISLSLVLWTMIAVGIIFGMVAQLILSGGQTVVNPWIYLKTGLLGFGISFALQAFLVMFIQNFMPNRITGMLVSGAVIFGLTFFVTRLPFFHPLMDYGSVSPGNLSEMSGYANLSRFKNFGIYWGSLALLLAIVSIWVFRRGLQDGLGARLKNMRANMRVPSIALAVAALAGFIGMGTVIHGAYEDGEYRNLKQREQRVVDYEKLVKSHEDDPQPEVTSVSADVQFFPKKREAVVSGTMTLFNPHDAPLREFILKDPVESDEDIRALVVVGATEVSGETYADAVKTYDYRIMRFDTPLPAGGEATLSFETFYHAPRLGDGSVVVANGTFVNNTQVMPQIGYVDGYQENPDKRRKFDLPEKERMPERDDMEARQDNFFDAHSHYVDFNATVCTDAGQIGIAPGEMTRKYDGQDGRSCRDYKAIQPIANFFSFMSGDYVVASDTWNAPDGRTIPLEIFHYADHDYNVELMLKAMGDAFTTYTREFGPYQYSQLRIVEFPYQSFAQSFAGTVPFSENIGFVMDPGDADDIMSVDTATYVTMHEIGHQWFGHQIMPARAKGFNVLSEGLTENASLIAYEEQYGWQKTRKQIESRFVQGYLTGRIVDRDDEPPLALSEGQQYLDYLKAGWVFWGLKQYMGEPEMQGAIRKFVTDYGQAGPPYPTTLQLTDYLREAAGPDYDQLITDYWDRITFWDLGFVDSTTPEVKPNAAGGYDVTVQIDVDKLIASEEDGKETSVTEIEGEALNEWIEIGFYAEDPKDTLGGDWMALERVRVNTRESRHTFTVPKAPRYVVVDPRRLLIERNVDDNVVEIDGARAAAD